MSANGNLPELATYKRIVACSDGTWLSSNNGDGSIPSNVAKISRAIANVGIDSEGRIVSQQKFYHSGLGTGDLPFQAAIFGGLGWGLDIDVVQIYDFIANNYIDGDEIFLFGFSRGSYTVRSVAGMICNVGILRAEYMHRFPEMWTAYRHNTDGVPFNKSEWYLNNHNELGLKPVKVKVVGVWDTVGSLGIPDWKITKYLEKLGVPINKEFAFLDTRVSKHTDYCFQALAIDEKRLTFQPTLWHKTNDGPAKELKQCWFPGVHGNIGGQAETDRSMGDCEEIGYNTLAWMMDCVSVMLTFKASAITLIIEAHRRAMNTSPLANSWGCGPIVDNFTGIQGAFFRILGQKTRTPGNFPRPCGDGTSGSTIETFHPMLRVRRFKIPSYQPPSLKGFEPEGPDDTSGWKWVKQGIEPIPEYVLEESNLMSVAYVDD